MSSVLDTKIEFLKGVGPQKAELLNKELNIYTFGQLLEYYPFRYIDKSKVFTIGEINSSIAYIQLRGIITKIETVGERQSKRLVAKFVDQTGEIELIWFRGIKWIAPSLKINHEYILFGKPTLFNNKFNITHPEMDLVEQALLSKSVGLEGVYNSSEKLTKKGLSAKGIHKIQQNLIQQVKGHIFETLSENILMKYNLLSKEEAVILAHAPTNDEQLQKALFRLKFEELFFLQLQILQQKVIHSETIAGKTFGEIGTQFNTFYSNYLPFELTNAQKRVIKEIRKDLGSGKHMNRLLQGDVGSGKTMVALLTMLIAIDNGYQTSLMAPTEILATQHYSSIKELLNTMEIHVELLTGSTKASKRKEIIDNLSSGKINILIGTHALLEENVKFKNLGYVVVDEQHRFGVAQRAKLWNKSSNSTITSFENKSELPPHVLVMTATPIPRTLAMTLYGDLDVSVIDELPKGRKPIKTIHFFESYRLRAYGLIEEEIKKGRQVYIVYPLINESETMDYKDLMEGFENISQRFPTPQYQVSIVHGQMKSDVKDFEMQRFVRGETNIMVSTTVIEVGVNVPNASVMLIESAERFGLSQLHQLRGRVGRGAEQSFCILMSGNKLSSEGKQRLNTMVSTNDGFEIAEVDLKLRGPGDIQGTQQSGLVNLKIADLAKDGQLIQLARNEAVDVLKEDPILQFTKNSHIRNHLMKIKQSKKNWSKIS